MKNNQCNNRFLNIIIIFIVNLLYEVIQLIDFASLPYVYYWIVKGVVNVVVLYLISNSFKNKKNLLLYAILSVIFALLSTISFMAYYVYQLHLIMD
ncbi:MAG: hypothetical protein KAX49_11635 [Halanaerobiales bacterium]|nr:hypothetical protein [Halanaerobiales bacterium]